VINKSDKQEIRWEALRLWNDGHSPDMICFIMALDGYDRQQFHYIDRWVKQWDERLYRPPKLDQDHAE
jgi:hypothetical protein